MAARYWLKILYNSSKSNAKRKGYSHTISYSYLVLLWHRQQGRCYWLGIPMQPGVHSPLMASLDRLDNSKGYEAGNVVFSCYFANLGRNSISHSEFKEFIHTLKEKLTV